MNENFKPYLRKFFDDILVFSKGWVEHLEHLEIVLEVLLQNQLYAKTWKCSLGEEQLEYLGHLISVQGVDIDPTKIECVEQWPIPNSLKSLWGFLGLIGYYKRFIKDYEKTGQPLTDLLRKDNFFFFFCLE